MEHIRIDPKFRRRPRPKRAGWAAREVFKFLLEVSAEFDLHGRFPTSMQDVAWLAEEWANGDDKALPSCAVMLTENLAKLSEVGLTYVEEDTLVISDWEEFYKPKQSNAERQANFRSRKAGVTEVTKPVTRNASNKSNATLQHSTTQHFTKGEAAPVDAVSAPGALRVPAVAAGALPDRRQAQPDVGNDLRTRLEAVFLRARGCAYVWQPNDDLATRKLPLGDLDEVERRFENGLRRTKYPVCNGVVDLAKHWNAYATEEPTPQRDTASAVIAARNGIAPGPAKACTVPGCRGQAEGAGPDDKPCCPPCLASWLGDAEQLTTWPERKAHFKRWKADTPREALEASP